MELEHDLPVRRPLRRRRRCARSTSRAAASGRCGTSRPASTTVRSRRTSCRGTSAGTSSRVTVRRDGPARPRVAAEVRRRRLRAALLHALRGRVDPRRRCAASAPSTSSATTPTARAATACSAIDGHIWAIDNGLMFHHEFKLRTVIWEFGGERGPRRRSSRDLDRLGTDPLAGPLAELLDPFEQDALQHRARAPRRRAAASRSTRPAAATPGPSSDASPRDAVGDQRVRPTIRRVAAGRAADHVASVDAARPAGARPRPRTAPPGAAG